MSTATVAILVPAIAAVLLAGLNIRYQLRLSQQSIDSQHKLALQGRISTVYEDLLDLVGLSMEIVDATKPAMTIGSPPPVPAQAQDEHIRRVQARVGVHGSPACKKILERWSRRIREFFLDAQLLDQIQQAQGMTSSQIKSTYGANSAEQWQKVEQARKDLHGLVRELEDAISSEVRT